MSRFLVGATWDDAPHLSDDAKADLWASIPPYQRDARSKGIPQLGAGAIYPVAESDVRIKDFEIPKHWPRAFGMDAGGGAKPTAAVWAARDNEAQVVYIYSVYKRESAEPSIHSAAIKARGIWIPGVGDCAALIMTEHDKEQLIRVYQNLGHDLTYPDKSVETGIQETWELLSSGRLKVFASCAEWFSEFRLYRRDKHGRIKKVNDHLMDATRYLVRSGRERMRTAPAPPQPEREVFVDSQSLGLGWMGG